MRYFTDEEVFCKNSGVSQITVRRHYFNGKYSPYVCSICGQEPFWNGKELTLILDHINGVHTDDRLENLRWVCPNCNQQLKTTGYKKMRVQEKDKERFFCKECGKEITSFSESGLCVICMAKQRRICKRPSREELKTLIRTKPFTQIAEQFGVSDNAIRKWCDSYSLPRKVSVIKSIPNKEWESI